jgi:hypothetical protein
MPYKPTDTAEKIIALLENAKKLAVFHQRRTLAADAVEACRLLSEARSFPVPSARFNALRLAVRGKMNGELSEMFDDIKRMVVATDMGSQKMSSRDTSFEDIARRIRSKT